MILVASRRLRLASLASLYFAQGIPIGLLDVAMPAWLAEQGVGAGEIGAYAAAIGLPWAFKLVAGPFMDRYQYLAMGRRRPWVIGTQTALVLALAGLAVLGSLGDAAHGYLPALMVVGALVNACAATQDVAVDGMAIDVVPMNERGRANAFMAFGQVLGYGLFGGLSGVLLARFGLDVAALVAALAVAAVLALSVLARERAGERLLPWTAGAAIPDQPRPPASLRDMASALLRALALPMSLLLTMIVFLTRAALGMVLVVIPIVGVQELGHPAEQVSMAVAVASSTAAVLGLALGPVIDRVGARPAMIGGLLATAATAFGFALTPSLWSHEGYVLTFLLLSQVCAQVVFIAIIAQYMNMSWVRVAATQFAVYMAIANLARSAGAGFYGLIAGWLDTAGVFGVIGGLLVAACLLLQPFRHETHQRHLDALAARG
jgi:MFS transporter, PAT family, beta-lactamase induction signal transducer AmpG